LDVEAELEELRKSLIESIDEYLFGCVVTKDVKRFERFTRMVRDHIVGEVKRLKIEKEAV